MVTDGGSEFGSGRGSALSSVTSIGDISAKEGADNQASSYAGLCLISRWTRNPRLLAAARCRRGCHLKPVTVLATDDPGLD